MLLAADWSKLKTFCLSPLIISLEREDTESAAMTRLSLSITGMAKQ